MYEPVVITTPNFPFRHVADLDEHRFPVDDDTASELLLNACHPIPLPFHPKRLFSRMRVMSATPTTKVYYALTTHNEEMVVKKLRLRDSPMLQSYVELEVAISILCGNCTRVVRFHGVMRTGKNLWLVMEHMAVGSLARLRNAFVFREREIAYVLKQVLIALQYMHRRMRAHRDLKAHNVLVNTKGEVKLMDFGWACQLTTGHPTTSLSVGSVFWMAPEVHAGQPYTLSCDIWSLGILQYELAQLEPPNYSMDHESASIMIMLGPPPALPPGPTYTLTQHTQPWSAEFVDFSRACLRKEAHFRPTVDALLAHPLIALAYTDEEWIAMLRRTFPRWPVLPRF